MKKSLKIYEFPTVIEKDAGGYYFAYVPSLQGCYTQGKTLEDALRNIREVIRLHVEDRKKQSEFIPARRPVSWFCYRSGLCSNRLWSGCGLFCGLPR